MAGVLAKRLLVQIKSLELWQIAAVFVGLGLLTHFTGLNNPFQGDDSYQIVNNLPVHSLARLPELFQHSTFYNGEQLVGVYYRPLMSVTFAFVYALFGANPLPYHIVQLALYISSAFLLYLVLKHFLRKTLLALPLALIFLVHPMNSQVVYSIPTMQDALLFFFGILAIWLLIRYKSLRSMLTAAACLFLALLSKESGLVFTVMAFLYLGLFDRSRLRTFAVIMTLPVVAYLALKIHAVGIVGSQHAAPVDDAPFAARLLTAPSIALFYVAKFVFPAQLATGYYWVNHTFSIRSVLLPLFIDLVVVGFFVWLGFRVRRRLSKPLAKTYWFFAAWAALGTVLYLQFLKLDMTACETWFYFAMAGLLGMIGAGALSVKNHFRPELAAILLCLVIGALGVRTAVRGTDYSSQYNLAVHDAAVGRDNFSALSNISQYLIDHGKYAEAVSYARQSVAIYPLVSNYTNLGVALQQSGDYDSAVQAYKSALQYGDLSIVYENLGLIYAVRGDRGTAQSFLNGALTRYPHDFKLWVYLAVFEGSRGSPDAAKMAIAQAAKYGDVPVILYNALVYEQPLALSLLGQTVIIR